MKRRDLFELEDMEWYPHVWRECLTDLLSHFETVTAVYSPVAGLLAPMLEDGEELRVIDLCSGAGDHVTTVLEGLDPEARDRIEIVLTDKFPNTEGMKAVSGRYPDSITYESRSVDAMDVPEDLTGFRTFFTSFHHFSQKSALSILKDATGKRQGIGIFDFTERQLLRMAGYGLPIGLYVLLKTPFATPFSWKGFFWTYIVPAVPFTAGLDGILSCLRAYSEDELRELTRLVGAPGYEWRIGRVRTGTFFHVTYCIGTPSEE